uniref:EGF-like domain-containing protein n=1 Tax=Parascaris univalens TaxID=6257 RepID=A0A915AAB3_PARUN
SSLETMIIKMKRSSIEISSLIFAFSIIYAYSMCPDMGDIPSSSTFGCIWVIARNSDGCLSYVEDCDEPRSCPNLNEVLWMCSSYCAPTCSNPQPTCGPQCGPPECQCIHGYLRDPSGKCIRADECPSNAAIADLCSDDELFKACSSLCEPTCFSDPNAPCALGCGPPKCECRPGLVRHDGICIWSDQCPTGDVGDENAMLRAPQQTAAHFCTANEEFVRCSSMCEPTCFTSPNQQCPLACGAPKCQCRQGFVRHRGQCIRPFQCPASGPPRRCDANEVFVQCSSLCEPTCRSRPNESCPLGCGPPKCECQPGFVRHNGRCIARFQCPQQTPRCGPNEQYVTCSSMCEPTCFTPPNQRCPLACGPPMCQCRQGYVRSGGQCIRRSDCPQLRRCRTQRDCPPNNVCRSGYCQQWYPGIALATADVEQRELRAGNDIPCTLDVHCPPSTNCVGNICVAGQVEDFSAVQVTACEMDSECKPGEACVENICFKSR